MNFSSFQTCIEELQSLIDRNQDKIIIEMNHVFINEEPDVINRPWYLKTLKDIKHSIQKSSSHIDDRFLVPIFIYKCVLKKHANIITYNFEFYSTQARIFSLLFSTVAKSKSSVVVPEEIYYLYDLCFYYFYFIGKYDALRNSIPYEAYQNYMQMGLEEATSSDNIYNYQIQNQHLFDFLSNNHSDLYNLKRKVERNNPYSYTKMKQYENMLIQMCHDKSERFFMIQNNLLATVIDSRLQKFIREFKNHNIRDAFSPENDFVFAVSYNNYTIVDFGLMLHTSEFIDKALLWGHYEKIYNNRLFEPRQKSIFTPINIKYNRLLTHYIADHLKSNGYVLPYDDGGRMPTIELKKLRTIRMKGDIDVLAYSPYSKCLLNIEFKNFQMSVHTENYYGSEDARVLNEEIFRKTGERSSIMSKNIAQVSDYLKIDKQEVKSINNIIITTRINLSLFVQAENQHFAYYSWNTFFDAAKYHRI